MPGSAAPIVQAVLIWVIPAGWSPSPARLTEYRRSAEENLSENDR
jgi:hypothetical protein